MIANNENGNLVTIVIPCYNHAEFVQDTIRSVINQDYDSIELIIIDDGSKDNSVEKIKEMIPSCKARFKRFEFRYRPNKGVCATLNEALEWSRGDYFSPIASDDILVFDKTKTQIKYLNKYSSDKVAGVFGRVSILKTPINIDALISTKEKPLINTKLFGFNDVFFRKSKLLAPTALLKTRKLKEVNGYNKDMKIEDFYLWLKLTENGDRLLFLDKVFAFYRRHPGNLSQNSKLMIDAVRQILLQYSQHPDYQQALARSYLVHAGDLAENKNHNNSELSYLLLAIKTYPMVVFSKTFLVFFYRLLL